MIISPQEVEYFKNVLDCEMDSTIRVCRSFENSLNDESVTDPEAINNCKVRIADYRGYIESLDRLFKKVVSNESDFSSDDEIQTITRALNSFYLDIETETLDMLKDGSMEEGELEEFINSCKKAAELLGRAGKKVDLKPLLDEVELLTDQEEFTVTLKKSELSAILSVLGHADDHQTWVYDVFNGCALKSGYKALLDKYNAAET